MQKVFLVIPTYNEKDNIGRLIDHLCEEIFPDIDRKDYQMNILVVDDSSPDGTGDVVLGRRKKHNNVHLLVNKKKMGLGGAYISGMNYAVDELSADILIEMDADFSHDPKLLPQFLKEVEKGNQLVLGSRYIPGGSIPDNWGLHRKFLSVVGNSFVRLVMWNFKIHDWTTGYRAVTKELYNELRKELKRSEFAGYTFQIGFLHKTLEHGARVSEVPLKFVDREFGKSKIGAEYIKNTLKYILKIRIKRFKLVIKFLIVGGVGLIVQIATMKLLISLEFRPDNAAAIGAEFAIISNFIWNNLWTFKDRKFTTITEIFPQFLKFNLASFGAVVLQKFFVWGGMEFISNQDGVYWIYFAFAILCTTILNFIVYNFIIWK